MRAHAIAGPWAAGERILVCVATTPSGDGAGALRPAAGRPAEARPGPRSTSRRPRHHRLGEAAARPHRRRPEAGRAAGRRDRHHARRSDIVAEILAYARRNNVTQIVIGKSDRSRWFELLHGSVVHDLLRKSGSISVHVMAEGGEAQPRRPSGSRPARPMPASTRGPIWSRRGRRRGHHRGRASRRLRRHHQQHRAGVPDRRCCSAPRATGCGRRSSPRCSACFALQLLLPAAAVQPGDRRPANVDHAGVLPGGRGRHREPAAPGPAAGAAAPRRGPGRRRSCSGSAASWRRSARPTTCCGPPPTRSPRC